MAKHVEKQRKAKNLNWAKTYAVFHHEKSPEVRINVDDSQWNDEPWNPLT
jgi:hypothetical protein